MDIAPPSLNEYLAGDVPLFEGKEKFTILLKIRLR
jgi:hypothetical protein